MKTFYYIKTASLALLLSAWMGYNVFAQNTSVWNISGKITDTDGNAIANQAVKIVQYSNWVTTGSYTNTVYTNANGYYHDSIPNGWSTGTLAYSMVIVHVTDCNGLVSSQKFLNTNSSSTLSNVNFSVCVTKVVPPDPTKSCKADFSMYGDGKWTSAGVTYYFVCNSSDGTTADTSNSTTGGVTCLALHCQCNGLNVHWSFGDGTYSKDVRPTHTYTKAGTYSVSLVISNSSGCKDSLIKTVKAETTPAPDPYKCSVKFTAANTVSGTTKDLTANFLTDNMTFSNTAGGTNNAFNKYTWSFGDGMSSTDQNPSHNYSKEGAYKACLTVTNADANCTHTFCDSVKVKINTTPVTAPSCDADFVFSGNLPNVTTDASGVENYLKYHFAYKSNVASTGVGLHFNWDFGDGNTSTEQYPHHIYRDAGTYKICLTIVSKDILAGSSCPKVVCKEITIKHPSNFCGGTVYAGTNKADSGWVFVVKYDSVNKTHTVVDTLEIGANGYFAIPNIYKGGYLFKAKLNKKSIYHGKYTPTYHGNKIFWMKSEKINSLGIINIYNADIHLTACTNRTGTAKITGNVYNNASGKMDKIAGEPVEGVEVMLLDENQVPIAVTTTDASGNYTFADVAYDSYQVYVDMWGKTTTPAEVTVDSNNPEVTDVNVEIGETEITSGTTGYRISKQVAGLSEIFPNPVYDNADINLFVTTSTNVRFDVYNNLGQVVSITRTSLLEGKHKVSLNVNDLPHGFYTVKIFADEEEIQGIKKFVKIK